MRRALAVLTLLACIPALAACGGSDKGSQGGRGAKPAAVPTGFKGYVGSGFSISYPDGWAPSATKADPQRLVELRPPTGGMTRPLIGVTLDHTGERTTLEAYAATFSVSQTMNIPGWRSTHEAPTHVPGATEGRLLEARYRVPGGGPLVREIVLFARMPGGRVYTVRAGGEATAFARDERALRTAVESFRPAEVSNS